MMSDTSRAVAAVIADLESRGIRVARDDGRLVRLRHPGQTRPSVYLRASPQWVTIGDHAGRLVLATDGRPWHRGRGDTYYARHDDILRHLGAGIQADVDAMAEAVRRDGPGDARQALRRLLAEARPCPPDHPHLVRRGCPLPAHGWMVDRAGAIVVPVYRVDTGMCVGAQRLLAAPLPDGLDRMYIRGTSPMGAVALVPPPYRPGAVDWGRHIDPSRPITVAEGVMSAWACRQAGAQVVACMSVAGMRPAVAAIRHRWPQAEIVIAADHDIAVRAGRLVSPAMDWAIQAAEEHGARIVSAWGGGRGEDARDVWVRGGREAVRSYLADTRSPEDVKRYVARIIARSKSQEIEL